ncbi:MAG: hypothetical protein DIZ78_13325 [endosymbiont of Escarpia spicata]|uniref:Uncharacterized protein n=1 Tax=endosymbiont of Escarpia spicata TaxID=2200908 RepID=A0A370DH61_9GAMM|nr:MAG: hypothetical protein DIZ78_13325 [endosymbiont of Escarpia spicata]
MGPNKTHSPPTMLAFSESAPKKVVKRKEHTKPLPSDSVYKDAYFGLFISIYGGDRTKHTTDFQTMKAMVNDYIKGEDGIIADEDIPDIYNMQGNGKKIRPALETLNKLLFSRIREAMEGLVDCHLFQTIDFIQKDEWRQCLVKKVPPVVANVRYKGSESLGANQDYINITPTFLDNNPIPAIIFGIAHEIGHIVDWKIRGDDLDGTFQKTICEDWSKAKTWGHPAEYFADSCATLLLIGAGIDISMIKNGAKSATEGVGISSGAHPGGSERMKRVNHILNTWTSSLPKQLVMRKKGG